MPVLLDGNSLHIDPRRRGVPVAKRVLRLDDTPRGLTHPSGDVWDYAVSPDGSMIVYGVMGEDDSADLWRIGRDGCLDRYNQLIWIHPDRQSFCRFVCWRIPKQKQIMDGEMNSN